MKHPKKPKYLAEAAGRVVGIGLAILCVAVLLTYCSGAFDGPPW